LVLPLGFRFDVDAIVIAGVAHRSGCERVAGVSVSDAVCVVAGGVHRAERCPRECPHCRPPFATLLTHQLDRRVGAIAP
jgi:hypothetical protein